MVEQLRSHEQRPGLTSNRRISELWVTAAASGGEVDAGHVLSSPVTRMPEWTSYLR